MAGRSYPKLITTIIPVYNVGAYLAETVESVIGQTIGFKHHVHLILIDDGSTDNSSAICKSYVAKYPGNIEYVYQENAGVSAARNNGLSRAEGKYVHFLDSDDIISKNYYSEGVSFLQENKEKIDFVAAKIQFFDASIDAHANNYKFGGKRVIDVDKDPDNPVLHVSSCLFVHKALKGRYFDAQLKIAEDARFVSDVLQEKRSYGVLSKSSFYYRKRSDGSSAINGQFNNRSFYVDTPVLFLEYLLDSWSQEGKTNAYAQSVVLYDMHWRLRQSSQAVLNEKEQEDYVGKMYELVRRIDDSMIVSKRGISLAEKRYLLRKKYGEGWHEQLSEHDAKYYVGNETLADIRGNSVHLDFIEPLGDGRWLLEGYVDPSMTHPSDRLRVTVAGVSYDATWVERKSREVTFLGDVLDNGGAFEVEVGLPERLGDDTEMVFDYVTVGGSEVRLSTQTSRFTGLSVLPFSYRRKKDFIFRKKNGSIVISPYSRYRELLCEVKYLGVIAMNWRLHTMKERLGRLKRYNLKFLNTKQKIIELLKPFAFSVEAVVMIPRAVLLRILYRVKMPLVKRPIWIISDRGMAAGDNGEALYRYIVDQEDVPADVYFAISKKSADYEKIKSIGGKIVNQDSLRYKLLFLLSSKVISSQADIETTNPFIRQIDHYVDLFRFDFVFLQHGIIRHDLSGWLNRFNKNIRTFVTSADLEYRSILEYPYYYTEDQVVLTGLPRYDRLKNTPKNKLILAPTYRKDVARKKTNANGIRPYDELFKVSDYFKFYNGLLKDQRLLKLLEEHNMTGEFYPHPVFAPQIADFDSSDRFQVMNYPYDYKTALSEGSLLVTDYSSIVFDFAYLKKPVLYTHFDVEEFYYKQLYSKGDFFSDDKDGFGQITKTHEDLVGEIIKTIEGGCKMPEQYRTRVDQFFYKTDRNNSRRVYEAIMSLDV